LDHKFFRSICRAFAPRDPRRENRKRLLQLLAQRLGQIRHFRKSSGPLFINPMRDLAQSEFAVTAIRYPLGQLLQVVENVHCASSPMTGIEIFAAPLLHCFQHSDISERSPTS
jgi:hypothetical protein